jgi:predicted polyphosphate/ATP-dependent NAD kinase
VTGPKGRALAFLVNPIAGMGGRVALKGTDGAALEQAIARGATPRAPGRAGEFAAAVKKLGVEPLWHTVDGPMGKNVLDAAGLANESVGKPLDAVTTARDTHNACREFLARGAALIVFVGGDGTARDIFEVVGTEVPILGVPSGVKMHSGVFAINPRAAAELVRDFAEGEARVVEAEVVDEDEEAMRQGRIEVSLKGMAKTIDAKGLLQASKEEYFGEVEEVSKKGIADNILEKMDDDTLYIIGPGSTTGAIMEAMGLAHTLLGVDLVKARKMVKADATDADIKAAQATHGGPAELIVSVIGHQGFVFGRGNLQITPEIIRAVGKKHITIVAAEKKVEALKELFVDTGEAALDKELTGHWRVLCGYRWSVLLPMRAGAAPE